VPLRVPTWRLGSWRLGGLEAWRPVSSRLTLVVTLHWTLSCNIQRAALNETRHTLCMHTTSPSTGIRNYTCYSMYVHSKTQISIMCWGRPFPAPVGRCALQGFLHVLRYFPIIHPPSPLLRDLLPMLCSCSWKFVALRSDTNRETKLRCNPHSLKTLSGYGLQASPDAPPTPFIIMFRMTKG
jgi:hypothetical protein